MIFKHGLDSWAALTIFFQSQEKLKELEDGFFAVQAEQEAIALNASSPEEASEFLSDECKYLFHLLYRILNIRK